MVNAYLTLSGRQAGNAGLTVLPAPDLSNPAGGAVEPQHLAYIVQWYLFALLALAAPFAVARSEVREARRTYLGIDPDAGDFGAELGPCPPALGRTGAAFDSLPAGRPAVRERVAGGRVAENHPPTAWSRCASVRSCCAGKRCRRSEWSGPSGWRPVTVDR